MSRYVCFCVCCAVHWDGGKERRVGRRRGKESGVEREKEGKEGGDRADAGLSGMGRRLHRGSRAPVSGRGKSDGTDGLALSEQEDEWLEK